MLAVARARPASYHRVPMDSDPPQAVPQRRTDLQRSRGGAELGFRRTGSDTALAHLFQTDPCRVYFPAPEDHDALQAVLITTSGGLTGGDAVRIEVACDVGCEVVVTGQAAEKIYRAAGSERCRVDIDVRAGAGVVLEWLPQETILFDGARLERRTVVELAPDARFLACEMLAFGRTASGEAFTHGFVHDAWRLKRDGRLVWADALQVENGLPQAAGFGGASACGFALYAGPDAHAQLEPSRTLLLACEEKWPQLRCGTSLVNTILLARFLGDSKDVRLAMMAWLAGLRAAVFGRPARMPRVWHI